MGRTHQTSPDTFVLISENPATGEILNQIPITTKEQVQDAVLRAKKAQAIWADFSVKERVQTLARFLEILVENMDAVCELICQETGKPKTEALLMEVSVVIDTLAYFLKRAPRILEEQTLSLHLLKNRKSYLRHVPRGVIGIISPWNFPWAIPMCQAMMGLIAGNAVLIKPSELTPLIALKAKELYNKTGLLPDLFQVLPGDGSTGSALIDSGIHYCLFTGSTQTGRKVAAACGERLIPYALELGGKTPALICKDAHIQRTAKALVWGAFANSGQVCVSIERAYVHKEIYDPLILEIEKEIQKLRQGNPKEKEVDIGSMTWNEQRHIVHEHVQKAKENGARVVIGGFIPEGVGLFYPPTLLVDCHPRMDVMTKEIFGPILPIMKVESEEEGIRLCNDSPFGLMGYIFTQDKHQGRELAEKINAGTVMLNDTLITFAAPETPWGGKGFSGNGRTHSDQGLRDLCELRHINMDRIRFKKELWWYPYREKFYRRFLKFLRFWFK